MTRAAEIRLLVLAKLNNVESFPLPTASLRASVNVTLRPIAKEEELLEHLDVMVARGWVVKGKAALDDSDAWEITDKGKLQLRSA